MNSAAVIVTLIFFAMAPWIIFQWKWSLIVMLPIIGLYLLYLVVRIVMPSGTAARRTGPAPTCSPPWAWT